MYEIIVILKALTEVAGVAMLGQGVLWVIAGAKRWYRGPLAARVRALRSRGRTVE